MFDYVFITNIQERLNDNVMVYSALYLHCIDYVDDYFIFVLTILIA